MNEGADAARLSVHKRDVVERQLCPPMGWPLERFRYKMQLGPPK